MMDRQNVSVHAVGYIQKLNDSLTHTAVKGVRYKSTYYMIPIT